MKKIDEGTFSLEGNTQNYFIQLYSSQKDKAYICKVYNRKGILKKLISEKYFITIFPDFHLMVYSTIRDIELYNNNQRTLLDELQKYKIK